MPIQATDGYYMLIPKDPETAAKSGLRSGTVILVNARDYLSAGPLRATARIPLKSGDTMDALIASAAADHWYQRGNDPDIASRKVFPAIDRKEFELAAVFTQRPLTIQVKNIRAFVGWFNPAELKSTLDFYHARSQSPKPAPVAARGQPKFGMGMP